MLNHPLGLPVGVASRDNISINNGGIATIYLSCMYVPSRNRVGGVFAHPRKLRPLVGSSFFSHRVQLLLLLWREGI